MWALMAISLQACTLPRSTETTLRFGHDSGEYLAGTLDQETQILPGSDQSATEQNGSTARNTYKLKRSVAVSVRQALVFDLSDEITVEAAMSAEVAHRRYDLPDGYLLSNGRTRLTDPITLRFYSFGLRPEAIAEASRQFGPLKGGLGAGVGVVANRIEATAKSDLLDLSAVGNTITPYWVFRARLSHSQTGLGAELRVHGLENNEETVAWYGVYQF